MAILAKVKVGKDFRLTLPKEVREFLELIEGNELVFYTIEDEKGRVWFRKI
ncbi:unnamed protein product [marine sediment metagenome]|uniref:SpoVT-AbrB domain-containing protein n=1 Tax=marine sediment metagenome TaxID=412755 RepID=X1V745_9ZZZZ